jgi:hypothetical protein
MSSSFSSNHLSLESLKLLMRCGFNPLAAQMRPTVEGLTPTSLAIDSRLQCVAPAGLTVSVSLIMRERIEAPMGTIRPGRVLSLRMPAKPICTYRCRQRPTFPWSCPNRRAIFLFSRPSAASKNHRRSFLRSRRTFPASSKLLQRNALLGR